jgi:hypothetical protein
VQDEVVDKRERQHLRNRCQEFLSQDHEADGNGGVFA